METVKSQILNDLIKASKGISDPKISIELFRAEDSKWGEYTTNIALKTAGLVGRKPQDIAKEIVAKLPKSGVDYTVAVAPNSFINFTLKASFLQNSLKVVLTKDRNFGKGDGFNGQKIQIEFISANPTGPLTLGNGRGGFVGDTLANVLQFNGSVVEREYYVNNVGNQIKVLGYSLARQMGIVSEEWEEFYSGAYVEELVKTLKGVINKLEPRGDDKFYQAVGALAAEVLLKDIQRVLTDKLKINFDRFYLERTIYDRGLDKKLLAQLLDKGLAFEKDGAIWFKTTQFNDDKDRVLVRSDGVPTYLMSDVVHKNEFAEQFDSLILLLGADHYGYQERLQASLEAFGHKGKLKIVIFQLVKLLKDGNEVRMSKRAGNYVALEDLVDEVGLDAARFFFLMYDANTHLNFDLELAKKKTTDNPVYYVQYAHARLCSILKKAAELSNLAGPAEFDLAGGTGGQGSRQRADDPPAGGERALAGRKPGTGPANLGLLVHPSEMQFIREIYFFPELVASIAQDYQVQKLPFYAIILAESLHKFYQDCVVISEDKDLTAARLELVRAAKIVLRNTLNLMGVSAPESM